MDKYRRVMLTENFDDLIRTDFDCLSTTLAEQSIAAQCFTLVLRPIAANSVI